MKAISLAAQVFAALAFTTLSASAATANHHRHHSALKASHMAKMSNRRCGGISYGTGARSCGTATGGPAGGISSRN